MENEGQDSDLGQRRWEARSPALAGVNGRMRFMVGDRAVGVLAVNDGHLSMTDDGDPVDVTVTCATRDVLVKLLRGQINPVVAALRGELWQRGNREFGVKVVLGLRAGSPFVNTAFDGMGA